MREEDFDLNVCKRFEFIEAGQYMWRHGPGLPSNACPTSFKHAIER
jgi:hypothetical protein